MQVMALACARVVLAASFALLAIVVAGPAGAQSCSPGPTGLIKARWDALGGCGGSLGAPVGPEQLDLVSGGSWQDFERGQITVQPSWAGDVSAKMSKFVLSAYSDSANTIHVEWGDASPYSYDKFILRWDVDNHEEAIAEQHAHDGFLGLGDDKQQMDVDTAGSSGRSEFASTGNGTYIIAVEGCSDGDCDQGWSFPVEVEIGAAVVPHPAQIPLPRDIGAGSPPLDGLDGPVIDWFDLKPILERACAHPDDLVVSDGPHKGELNYDAAIAALQSLRNTLIHCGTPPYTPTKLRELVNEKIRESGVGSIVGTDIGGLSELLGKKALFGSVAGGALGLAAGGPASGWQAIGSALGGIIGTGADGSSGVGAIAGALIGLGLAGPSSGWQAIGALAGALFGATCGGAGDYDMHLVGVLQIIYRYRDLLDDDTQKHILDDLLTERGGAGKRNDFVWFCGLPTIVPETENHVLMTETARYLTNQLLARRAIENGQTVPDDYNNDKNGMNKWMLEKLQSFLQYDFYEFNARPYAREAMFALSNLYEFAAPPLLVGTCTRSNPPDPNLPPVATACHVRRGARMVMDYLAARFATASLGLRRASSFRRQVPQHTYSRLFGRQSDGMTWRYTALTGGSNVFFSDRHGRIDGQLEGSLIHPALGTYRVPYLIVDLMSDKGFTWFQRHYFNRDGYLGVEITYRDPDYLITAGGIHDQGHLGVLSDGEDAWALPTTLTPLKSGTDYRSFVRIDGAADEEERVNTCVAPAFACGLNIEIPPGIPEACIRRNGNWTFIDFNANSPGCTLNYGYYVVVYRAKCDTSECKSVAGDDGTYGFFHVTPHRVGLARLEADILAANGTWNYKWDGVNLFYGVYGTSYTFMPYRKEPLKWGLVTYTLNTLPTNYDQDIGDWPLAQGEIMQSTGHDGCVIIDNSLLKERLILDFTKATEPRRTRLSTVGQGARCGCPLIDACLPPRYE